MIKILFKICLIFILVAVAAVLGFFFFQQQILAGPAPLPEEEVVQGPSEEEILQMTGVEALDYFEQIPVTEILQAETALKSLAKRQDVVGYLANEALGKAYDQQGQPASPYYRQALSLYEDKEIKMSFARALEAEGSLEEALQVYGTLLPQEEALSRIMALLEPGEAVTSLMAENKQWSLLLTYLMELEASENPPESSPLLLQHQAQALAELGRYGEALPLLEVLAEQEGVAPLSWWRARSLEAVGREAEAIALYRTLGQEGGYRLGLLLEKQGELGQAAQAFALSTADLSKWRAARLWEQLGNWQQALTLYKGLAANTGSYQYDGAYRAYVLANRYQQPGAEEMAAVLSSQPAWMNRLGREKEWSVVTLEAPVPAFLTTVEALRDKGYGDLADIELAIGEKLATLEEKVALSRWYAQENRPDQSVVWANRVLREQPVKEAYYLAYPKPYEELVLEAAQRFNLDPYLIWSIMREESYYRADAVSWVGALGLMQIMPATGKEISERLRMPVQNTDLLKPEINITFGSYYIGRMLSLFDGNRDKALAAYNGGQGNVRKWEQSVLGTAPEDFPTAIAFQETLQYITKVSNSYFTYRWLYGAE